MNIVSALSGIPYLQYKIILDAIVLGKNKRGWHAIHNDISIQGESVAPEDCSAF